jgi:hypothetical protein
MAMSSWESTDISRIYTQKAAQKKPAGSGAPKPSFAEATI